MRVLRANVGKRVLVTPIDGSEPNLLLLMSVDDGGGEGFTYHILNDPALYDPKVLHFWQYLDVADVRPADADSSGES